jgi:hypothetical protein
MVMTDTCFNKIVRAHNVRHYTPNSPLLAEPTIDGLRAMRPELPPFMILSAADNYYELTTALVADAAASATSLIVDDPAVIPTGGCTMVAFDTNGNYFNVVVSARSGASITCDALSYALKRGDMLYYRKQHVADNIVIGIHMPGGVSPFKWLATQHGYERQSILDKPRSGMFAFGGEWGNDPPSYTYGCGVYGGPYVPIGAHMSILTVGS